MDAAMTLVEIAMRDAVLLVVGFFVVAAVGLLAVGLAAAWVCRRRPDDFDGGFGHDW